MTKPSLHIRLLFLIVLVVLAATGAYVFTASNTVPNTNAGSGSGSISGYTISTVAYNLNSTNPNNIDTVTFTIAPTTAGTVKIQVVNGAPGTPARTRPAASRATRPLEHRRRSRPRTS
jgi:hypothetical protein